MNLSKYVPFLKDAGERAVKTFAGGFITGAGLSALGGSVAASDIPWMHGVDVGLGTTVLSVVFSLASLKVGSPGTASLTNAVEAA